LIARFRAAVDCYLLDARAQDLPSYVANLHQIERDVFDLRETTIDLPGWVGD
jgi:predicted ATPase